MVVLHEEKKRGKTKKQDTIDQEFPGKVCNEINRDNSARHAGEARGIHGK